MTDVFKKINDMLKEKKDDYDDMYRIFKKGGDKQLAYTTHEILKVIRSIRQMIGEMEKEYNDGWIPVSERLPEDGDCGFYMCIVENHEEDLPMFCQFEEEYGFGFRHDIYDEHTLGFVDSEFRTNEELGYEKVIAWRPLPDPYKPKGENNA